jgi:hypothetical protein
MISDRQHTAFHEAGHAVIGRVLSRMPFGPVTIKANFKEKVTGNATTPNQIK